jgi:hypothetical protein
MSQPAADEMQHQLSVMDSEPASTKTPVCTETVSIPASANTSPASQPATDEENMPTVEASQAEDDPDEQNDSTYLSSV